MTKRKKNEPYFFVVEGAGEFPYDMLRYDQCWPVREAQDSHRLSNHGMTREGSERRAVLMATKLEGAPTAGRWSSFTWELTYDSADRMAMERYTDNRNAELEAARKVKKESA